MVLPLVGFMLYYNDQMDEKLFEPRIYKMPVGKVLVVRIQGDPDITMDTAGITLYSIGRILKLSPSYIIGRHEQWNQRELLPPKQWFIDYSRIVPETATDLIVIENTSTAPIYYERRDEVEVAEILHIGRYEEIPHSIEKLKEYIKQQGYQLNGFYEELYLVFEQIEPDPKEYETILRYQVEQR